jgi:hypothetical protein
MRAGTLALFGLAALGFGAVAAARGKNPNDDPGGGAMGWTRKQTMWNMLESVGELAPVHRYALMLIASREGGYNPAAHNGSVSERAASMKAAQNNPTIVSRALACGVPLSHLQSGSWTTFQLLAPYVSGTAFEVFGSAFCPFADPERAQYDLAFQIAMAIEHARDLQGYDGFDAWPTVGALYLGWGAPSRMGSDAPVKWGEKLDVYRDKAREQGFPEGIVDAHLPRFPSNPSQIYADLRARFG